MADIIEIMEDRVAILEKQIFGSMRRSEIEEKLSEPSVVENLMNANVYVTSALSGRESANVLMTRLPELNSYLDSNFEESDLHMEAKLEFILAMESDIKENLRLLTEMQKLLPVLETDRIRDVPELSEKMNELTLNYLKMDEESKNLTGEIHELFNNYNSIVTSISESLIAMDANVTSAEIAAIPVKQID